MLDPKSLSQPDDSGELAPKKPPSSARVEANRRNASRSNRQKTPRGKKNSSRNARKHNLLTSQRSPVASDSISTGASARTTLRRSRTGKPGEGIKRDVAVSADNKPSTVSSASPPKIRKPPRVEFDNPSLFAGLTRAFGTNDRDSIFQLLIQVVLTNGSHQDDPQVWNCLLATLHDIAPKDALEGLLAVQMAGVHQLAMAFLARAVEGQSHEGIDANVNRANKLLRTFTAQMEALNRHRGKITQPMVVGNVNIADGGQAIVGSVNHPGPGKASKDDEEKKVG